jgi:hypothetical protein
MRMLAKILSIHPAFSIIIPIGFLVIAICSAAFFDWANNILDPDYVGFFGEQDSPWRILLAQLSIARPWLAFAVGLIIGFVAFSIEKRKLQRDTAQAQNIERLAAYCLLPAAETRKRRGNCWKPPPFKWALLGTLVASIFACVFRFSLKVCLFSLFSSWILLYPEYRRMYDGVFGSFMSAETVGRDVRAECQAVRKKARIVITATAFVLGCLLSLLVYLTTRVVLEPL